MTLSSFIFLLLTIANVQSHAEFEEANKMKDDVCPLRLTLNQHLPYTALTRLPNGSYDYSGFSAEIFHYVARKLNRPLLLVLPSDEEIHKYGYIQSSWNQLLRDEADIDGISINPDAEQLKIVDIPYPVIMTPFRMIVPAPVEESRLFAFVRPFQPMVWLFLFVSIVGAVVTASTLNWLYDRWDQQQRTNRNISNIPKLHQQKKFSQYLGFYTFYCVRLVSNFGLSNPFNRNAMRMFGAFLLLMMTVLVYSYSGLLISSLTVPRMTKPIETLEEVAASTDVILFINPDQGLGKRVMSAESGLYKELRDQIQRRPDAEYYRKALTEKDFGPIRETYATPQLDLWTTWLIGRLYKKEKKCRFHRTKPIPFALKFSYPLKKGGLDNELISRTFMDLWEFGIIGKLNRELFFIPGSEKCLNKKQKAAKEVPIKLADLTSAFLILGIGLGASILCFLIELIVAKYKYEMNFRKSKVVAPVKVVRVVKEETTQVVATQSELRSSTVVTEIKSF